MNITVALILAANAIRPGGDMRDVSMRPPDVGGAASTLTLDAMPFERTVVCGEYIEITGTSTGAGAVSWSASPSGESGACTGTDSFACLVSVSPDATGEGVETITVTRDSATDDVTIGFYVAGAHSCFLAQDIDGNYNASLANLDAVATWSNSGTSGLDVTQGTGTAQPTYRTGIVGGQPVVRCDGGDSMAAATASDWTFLSDGTGSTASIITSTTSSGFGVLFATSRVTDRGIHIRYETTFKLASFVHDGTSITLSLATANNAITSGSYYDVTQTFATASTPDITVYLNNTSVLSGTPSAISTLAPSNPLTVCKSPASGTLHFTGDVFRLLAYPTELSSTQRGINKAVDEWALNGTLPVVAALDQPQPNRIVFLGDSITKGSQGVTAWPTKFAAAVPFKNYVNAAVSGATVADIRGQFDSNCVWPTSTIPGTVVILGGVNDVRTGATAAATWSTLSGIYADATAQGTTVVAMTVMPFGSSTIYGWSPAVQTQLEALNTSIRASGMPHVVDLYTLMGDTVDPQDLLAAYSAPDGIHPSEAGSTFISDTVQATLGL